MGMGFKVGIKGNANFLMGTITIDFQTKMGSLIEEFILFCKMKNLEFDKKNYTIIGFSKISLMICILAYLNPQLRVELIWEKCQSTQNIVHILFTDYGMDMG